MRANTSFRSFLDLDSMMPESVSFQPLKMSEINNLSLGGRDFAFVKDRGLLFVAMSEMSITNRMDSYITNVSQVLLRLKFFCLMVNLMVDLKVYV